MFRAAPRFIARSNALRTAPCSIARPTSLNPPALASSPARRHLSTAPPSQQRRSWKSLFARLGVAGTLLYYYNTTDVFAEEPGQAVVQVPSTDTESETLPTIESLSSARQERRAVQAQLEQQKADEATRREQGGIEGLEEEADQQGAFNPETGEINWDCPCLGGMADGPCGEEFKGAFSCFVFSKEEPKGMDCIDKFKNMQNCFRQYPEIYGSEIDRDEEEEEEDDMSTPAVSNASRESPSTPASSVPAGDEEGKQSAPGSEKSKAQGQLSGEKQGQDSPPRIGAEQTSLEPQSSPESPQPSSRATKRVTESNAKPAQSSTTALVPAAYRPDAKSESK